MITGCRSPAPQINRDQVQLRTLGVVLAVPDVLQQAGIPEEITGSQNDARAGDDDRLLQASLRMVRYH